MALLPLLVAVFVPLALYHGAYAAHEECGFIERSESALYSHNDLILNDVSTEHCKEACLGQEECLSFDFVSDSGNCYISTDNQYTAPGYLGSHDGSSYYEKLCVNVTDYPDHTDMPVEHTVPVITEEHNFTMPNLYNTSICRLTQLGKDYVGQQQVSSSGRTCQQWNSNFPHEHSMRGSSFPEGDLRSAVNYCRNPDGEPGGPWCYTTDPDVRWEYCEIPFCPGADFTNLYNECKKDIPGRTYRGMISASRSGRQCQYWIEQHPHKHSMTWKGFPEGNMAAAANFCRNPDGEPEGPWCYTTDHDRRWEYCDVDLC